MRVLLSIGLTLTVGLLVTVFAVHEANRQEVERWSEAMGGAGTITFRLKVGVSEVPKWTPKVLDELSGLPEVGQMEWRGGTLLSQGPRDQLVIPIINVSPGLLTLLEYRMAAGRQFDLGEADQQSVVIGQSVGERLFGTEEATAHLGQTVVLRGDRFTVIGVAEGTRAAYRAVSVPSGPNSRGFFDVDAVYLAPADGTSPAALLDALQDFLAIRPDLSVLEPVRHETFVAGGVDGRRVAFLAEANLMFRMMAWLAGAFTTVVLTIVATLKSHRSMERWVVLRAVGATRRNIAMAEVLSGSLTDLLAITIGALIGWLAAEQLGGSPTPWSVALAAALGCILYCIGTLPAVVRAVVMQPVAALRSGAEVRTSSSILVVATLGTGLALAITIVANGIVATGEAALSDEIKGIGASAVLLAPDRSTLLPVAALAPSHAEALRSSFPDAKITFIDEVSLQISSGSEWRDVAVIRSDLDFPHVTGTGLAAGAWSEEGVVLGSALAVKLFPEQDALGQRVRLAGLSLHPEGVRVVGVAQAPTSERLESLQLGLNSVWVPSGLASDTSTARARLYVDASTVPSGDVTRIAEALDALVPGFAPHVAVEVAGSFLNYLSLLSQIRNRLQVASMALVPSVIAALVVLISAGGRSRRRRRAVERIAGATWRNHLQRELTASITMLLMTIATATGVAWLLLKLWAQSGRYHLSLSLRQTGVAIAVVAVVGFALAVASARRAAAQPPAQELSHE